ncbi:Asp-tRNA(Asn)/Glu-tRNA(Gln) amidotransferase subunit GatC [Candidatus Saccharibacteria bacterium]|nr:Asp-tRNA(Asn)/Glu-tRNA(Gln) amidotransferase subunit GatC [Candidatus Saccharibacteria bacterium]
MTQITRNDVLKLAKLSNIKLRDEEVDKFVVELDAIVNYVEQIDSVKIDDLKPTDQVTGLENVTRPDEVIKYDSTGEELLKNLPNKDGKYIKVKRVL